MNESSSAHVGRRPTDSSRQRRRAETQVCHLAPQPVMDSRRLLLAAAAAARASSAETGSSRPIAIEGWPEEDPSISESVREFIPTAVCLNHGFAEPRSWISENPDHERGFRISYYVAEAVRHRPGGRVRRVAVRSFVAPPANQSEAAERGLLMAAVGKGVTNHPEYGTREFVLTGKLLNRERRIAADLRLDEQVALVTMLAARDGLMAAFSPQGEWPQNPFLDRIARRLGCRVVRFNFRNIPRDALRRLRHSRYVF